MQTCNSNGEPARHSHRFVRCWWQDRSCVEASQQLTSDLFVIHCEVSSRGPSARPIFFQRKDYWSLDWAISAGQQLPLLTRNRLQSRVSWNLRACQTSSSSHKSQRSPQSRLSSRKSMSQSRQYDQSLRQRSSRPLLQRRHQQLRQVQMHLNQPL